MVEINKVYNYFDDGKINKARRLFVTITDIIPFDKIDNDTLSLWKEEVENFYWLYAKNTDYFIKGNLNISKNNIQEIYFVRTINYNYGWFSIGYWGGRLDVDNSLFNSLFENEKE